MIAAVKGPYIDWEALSPLVALTALTAGSPASSARCG